MCIVKKLSLRRRELEFLPALYMLAWGIWLLNPWINSFASSAIYRGMSHIAPEWAWGTFVGLVGLYQTLVLFTNRYKLRASAALLSMFTLFTMSLLVGFGNFSSTAMISYLVIAICSWLGFTELLADIKERKT
jgi:hypothetical protein